MTCDRALLLREVQQATRELLEAARDLSDREIRQASALPGWTRADVLAHVALGGDAMHRLLLWARAGVANEAYASQAARDEAIDVAAALGVEAILAHLAQSASRFQREAEGLPDAAWPQRVRVLAGAEFPAAQLLERRLAEVVLHHTDLDIGYTPEHWPSSYAQMALKEPMLSQRNDRVEASRLSRA